MADTDDLRLMDAIRLAVFGILVLGASAWAHSTFDMLHKVWVMPLLLYIIGLTTLVGGVMVVHQIWRRRRALG